MEQKNHLYRDIYVQKNKKKINYDKSACVKNKRRNENKTRNISKAEKKFDWLPLSYAFTDYFLIGRCVLHIMLCDFTTTTRWPLCKWYLYK